MGFLRKQKRIWIPELILLLLAAGCFFYVNDYYHADGSVKECLQGNDSVTVSEIAGGLFLDGPGEENALIFYPGAKVEYTAYAPLFSRLAEQGIDCFLVKMPCNLAFLGQNKASGIEEARNV